MLLEIIIKQHPSVMIIPFFQTSSVWHNKEDKIMELQQGNILFCRNNHQICVVNDYFIMHHKSNLGGQRSTTLVML